MITLRFGLASLLLCFLAACSSTGSVKGTSKEQSARFLKGVKGAEARSFSGSCPTSSEAWDALTWPRLNEAAGKCIREGKWSVLEKMAHFMAQKFYHSPWGLYYLSVHADHINEGEQALWFIEAALQKSHGALGLLHYQKGRVLLSLQEDAEAYDAFEKALQLDPELWSGHIYVGQQAFLDGDHAKAQRHLGAAFQKDQLVEKTHFHMLAKSHEARKKWEEAVAVLDRALRRHRDSVDLKILRASILEEGLKDLRAALRAYEDILKSHPQPAQSSVAIQDRIDRLRKSLERTDKERVPAGQGEKA